MRLRDSEKQQRIKEAMIRLILRDGISGTSVAKIAREAGVSPATIYIYYENKEEMMAEVFREYSHDSYRYLMRRVRPEMSSAELIEAIVRGYYRYTVEHEEEFSFVEQCSRCPTLSGSVREAECCCDVLDLIHAYQKRGEIRRISDRNIGAVLFSPVRFLAMNRAGMFCGGDACGEAEAEAELRELVKLLQELLAV